jgi:hypothetical protein
VGATGLAANPTEYRKRLGEQTDDQLDTWAKDLMRDVSIRKGVIKVVADFRKSARLDEAGLRRVFARGGGAPQTIGFDAAGNLMVPAISLHFLVSGLRSDVPDASARLTDFLVANFQEIVYV